MSLFQQRFEERVRAAESRAFGVLMKLLRASGSTEEFTGTWEQHMPQVQTIAKGPININFRERKFKLPAERLVINGEVTSPRAGDRLQLIESGEIWEIMPNETRPAVDREAGDYRWAVFAKRVGT